MLEDFNYLFNKAINLYINKLYNIYDVNLPTTDSLRVLTSTAVLDVTRVGGSNNNVSAKDAILGATYEAKLPLDYLHLLNCLCNFKVNQNYRCYDSGTYVLFGATRLTADIWPVIVNNFYMKPSYKKPYYYLHNVNTYTDSTGNIYKPDALTEAIKNQEDIITRKELPTNPVDAGTDQYSSYTDTTTNNHTFADTVTSILNGENHTVALDKPAYTRKANPLEVRIEIRAGKDASVFELKNILVDYIKAPQFIRLTPELIDTTIDHSQVMEFPDFVCQEIINELVHIVMENTSDPRLQTHPIVSQSIANPAQQLAPNNKK